MQSYNSLFTQWLVVQYSSNHFSSHLTAQCVTHRLPCLTFNTQENNKIKKGFHWKLFDFYIETSAERPGLSSPKGIEILAGWLKVYMWLWKYPNNTSAYSFVLMHSLTCGLLLPQDLISDTASSHCNPSGRLWFVQQSNCYSHIGTPQPPLCSFLGCYFPVQALRAL